MRLVDQIATDAANWTAAEYAEGIGARGSSARMSADTENLPLHPGTNGLINDYLDAAGHGTDENVVLFRPVKNNTNRRSLNMLLRRTGFTSWCGGIRGTGVRDRRPCMRATAATNALDHQADIAKVRNGWAREHRHHPHLLLPENPAGGQPDVQGGVLIWRPGLRLTGQRHNNGLTR